LFLSDLDAAERRIAELEQGQEESLVLLLSKAMFSEARPSTADERAEFRAAVMKHLKKEAPK